MYEKELKVALRLARIARKLILKGFFSAQHITTKKDGSPVTDVDLAINQLVIDAIKKAFPEHGVLGEEQSYNTAAKFLWVCDPLDGTKPFIMHLPISCFVLALCKDGFPVISVIADPFRKRIYHAISGEGAHLNGKKLIRHPTSEQKVLAVGGSSANTYEGYDQVAFMRIVHDEKDSTLRLLCAASSATFVIDSTIKGYVLFAKSPWDVAAQHHLVVESGGIATDLEGNITRFDKPIHGCIFADTKESHAKLLELVKRSQTR